VASARAGRVCLTPVFVGDLNSVQNWDPRGLNPNYVLTQLAGHVTPTFLPPPPRKSPGNSTIVYIGNATSVFSNGILLEWERIRLSSSIR